MAAWLMASGLLMPGLYTNAQAGGTKAGDAALPRLEVAAIKPAKSGDNDTSWSQRGDRVSIENYTLRRLIRTAYGLKSDSQVVGGPKWTNHKTFDILAKIDDVEAKKMQEMTWRERAREGNRMVQQLLADRFRLKASEGKRILPIYALVVTKSGVKFKLTAQKTGGYHLSVTNGHMTATATSMETLARYLTGVPATGNRVVLDRTGMKGEYDFKMNWTRDEGQGVPPDAVYPGLFTALKEQLGLELKPEKAPVTVVIVESAREPEMD